MNSRALRLVLRGLAILIAVAGVVDPAITSNRASKARVAVVATDNSRDSALARRASRSLGKRFMVIDAPLSATDATVLIGDRLPRGFRELSTPIFAVEGDSTETHIAIEAVRSPTVAPLDARVPVAVAARARGARGRMLDVILTSNGVVVDRTSRPISADDQVGATLSFVPTAAGTAPLRVSATIAGTKDTASADVVTDIRQTRWPVLFFDPHPSWMSTFVRRAVERDPRFVVTSRVVTSRNVSTDAGNPPSRLDDLVGTERFDAIVVGTPDALSDQDIAGLEDFARRRGGSIVFLYDQRSTGKSARLTHATAWAMRTNRTPVPIVRKSVASGGTPDTSLLATEIAWPQPLPSNVDVLARTVAAARDSSANRVVLWRAPVGAGRVIVSTALDAWRFRDRAQSSFDRLWQSVIADAASASPPPIAVQISPAPLAPGEWADISVTLRDVALRDVTRDSVHASVSARIVSADSAQRQTSIRLWPTANIGEFRTTVRAPARPGTYRVVASADGLGAEAPMVVAGDVSRATASDLDLIEALATRRGGAVFMANELDRLAAAITAVVRPSPRLETWHPMRSPWWILPFALALGGEWLLRRRNSLA